MKETPFKICPNCRYAWPTMEGLLADPEIELVGYQVAFEDLEGGLFYFNHLCGTTLAMPVKTFRTLSSLPIVAARSAQPDGCPSLCVHRGDLNPCPVECECTWVREVMQVIRNWEKRPSAAHPLL